VSARALVIGAGLSGLTAAFRLHRAGVDVVVLEARDRVGGRAWRVPVGEVSFDAGCEALDHEHAALRELATELGVRLWEAPPWASEPPGGLEGADAGLFEAFEQEIEALAARVDPDHPEDLDGADALDAQSLAGWLEERGASRTVLDAAEARIAVASSTVPMREMSLLAYAVKLAAGAAPTGLTLRFEGGPSTVAERLAARIEGRVRLGSPVAGVEDTGDQVLVRLRDGTSAPASRVVVAVPLTLQREIAFDPPLPGFRQRALADARYGVVVKEATLFDSSAPVPSPDLSADGHFYRSAEDDRLLIRFAGAEAAGRSPDIGRLVGTQPQAHEAIRWSDEPWTRGTYLILGPGQLLDWGRRLAEPHGRIHFAGAERSTLKSYMDGAVRAGNEVAEEILLHMAG
jgi:monoamine oxidase